MINMPILLMNLKYSVLINAIIYAKKDWELRPSLLKYNVEREGIEIV